jgi:(R,R)-butanediol dehydrogenase/meso-butanediol dehydrogenase/diacetyl reductase
MKALQFSVSVPQYLALTLLGAINKGLFYSGPLATARLVDMPEPALPSPDWVKVKTLMCGFCGSDLNLILLRESPTASPFSSFPCTMGHEICGEVAEVGSGVQGFKQGDAIILVNQLGCAVRGIADHCRSCREGRPSNCENMAEGKLAPGMFTGICRDTGGGFAPCFIAHKDQLFRLPEGISIKEAALFEPLGVSLQAVLENRPQDGDKVLVIGAGVIGNLVVQSIRALGVKCQVTVAEPDPFAAETAVKAGADRVLAGGDLLKHTVEITGAHTYKPMIGKDVLMGGFSKIFDCVASEATLFSSMRALETGGTLSMVGIGKDVKLDLTPLWLKLQTIKGAYSSGYVNYEGGKKHVFEIAAGLVRQKKINLESMVTHAFKLEDYRRMIEVNLHKGKYKALKTVVSFD